MIRYAFLITSSWYFRLFVPAESIGKWRHFVRYAAGAWVCLNLADSGKTSRAAAEWSFRAPTETIKLYTVAIVNHRNAQIQTQD